MTAHDECCNVHRGPAEPSFRCGDATTSCIIEQRDHVYVRGSGGESSCWQRGSGRSGNFVLALVLCVNEQTTTAQVKA